ncbi:MAG: M1 family aminopeptidase [Candidatus Acidiferrales bacterium]
MTRFLVRISFFILLNTSVVSIGAAAQGFAGTGPKTPQELAALVIQQFASGSAEEFNSVDPDPGGQRVVQRALKQKAARRGDLSRVIWRGPDRAVLLLTGTVGASNSGEETTGSRDFSGLYEAAKSNGVWTLVRRLPIDQENHILSQAVQCTILPGEKISVQDQVGISVGGVYGFAVRLNDRAKLSQVKLGGKPAKYEFGGGVLWLETPPRSHAELSLVYSLAAESHKENEKAPSSSATPTGPPAYGEFLNVDVWMPLFDFDSANDTAPISITARIPSAYYLTTSIPQTESVSGGMRIVRGRTDEPEFTLTLIFDRDWHPTLAKVGDIEFGTFLTSDFRWKPEQLEDILRKEYQMLDPRFGPPQSHSLAGVEERGIGESGFRYRANDLVVSGTGGGTALFSPLESAASEPNAPFPHEVSHGWTMQATGPAANTLREGWATYCEWMFVGEEYGDDVERDIWETAHNYYLLGGHDGVRSILGNPGNGSIHYVKGAWVFHMLEEVMGQERFDRGMREYIEIPREQPAGYEQFIAAMSHAEGHDMNSFVMPWLSGKYIPDISARVDGGNIIVTQTQPDVVFDLPLDLALTISSGKTVERSVHLTQRSDVLDVGDIGAVANVRIDPHHEFLLQRHFGETVHFELRAPDAKAVALTGNFALKPVPATKTGDVWVLDLPMSEGRYSWAWQVDGKTLGASHNGQPTGGVRVVQPLERLQTSYPK